MAFPNFLPWYIFNLIALVTDLWILWIASRLASCWTTWFMPLSVNVNLLEKDKYKQLGLLQSRKKPVTIKHCHMFLKPHYGLHVIWFSGVLSERLSLKRFSQMIDKNAGRQGICHLRCILNIWGPSCRLETGAGARSRANDTWDIWSSCKILWVPVLTEQLLLQNQLSVLSVRVGAAAELSNLKQARRLITWPAMQNLIRPFWVVVLLLCALTITVLRSKSVL